MDALPPESQAPPAPTPTATRPIDNAWWGMLLTMLVLAGLAAAIFGIWWLDQEQRSRTVERYAPASTGTTLSYRNVAADGAVTYLSANESRQEGVNALNLLSLEAQLQVVARTTGIAPDAIDSDIYGRYLREESGDLVMTRESLTSFAPTGPYTVTTAVYLIAPRQIEIVTLDGNVFSPPAPVLDLTLSDGQERVTTGTIGLNAPYTLTLRLEAREAVSTAIGDFPDCLRIRQILAVRDITNDARSWMCAGVGVVRQETIAPDGGISQRSEIVAASTPSHSLVAEASPSTEPGTTVALRHVVDNQAGQSLGRTWAFHEPGNAAAHITSPALVAGSRIYVGTVGGRVVAIDRETHAAAWRFETGGAIYGAPVLSDGTLYVGSTSRRLYALDARTGGLRWAFAVQDAISGGAAVEGGVVFVGSEDHRLYALDARTGTERWRFETSASIASTPTVDGGVVYVGSDDGALYALDAQTGALRWAYATGDAIEGAPAVANGVVYVGSDDGSVYALAANPAEAGSHDGEALWMRDLRGSVTVDMLVHDGLVIAQTAEDEVFGLDAASGAQRWIYRSDTVLRGSPLVFGDRILLNSTGRIVALDLDGQVRERFDGGESSYPSLASDGREIVLGHQNGYVSLLGDTTGQPWQGTPTWTATRLQSELFAGQEAIGTPLVPYGDDLLAVTSNGRIYRVSAADGRSELLGQVSDIGVALLPPTLSGDVLIIGNQQGLVSAFDLAQRRERWRTQMQGLMFSAAAVTGDRVLLASTHDNQASAAAFDMKDGREIWRKTFAFALGGGSSALLHEGRYYLVADMIHALEPGTGDELWAERGAITPYQIAADGPRLYAVGYDLNFSTFVATFDAATGQRQALVQLDLASFPNLRGGISAGRGTVLLAIADREVLAVDPQNGAVRWHVREQENLGAAPIVYGDLALYSTLDSRILARSLDDGTLVGDFSLQDSSGSLLNSVMIPTIVGDRLYAAFYQQVFALELARR
jgi:outer membrane protein assembly factor BamB